ncbi:MAG: ATP-binding protein, partial [Ruminococcus sp.]|nr:ATP-binding protein [Ruminococcus sp.]
MICGKICSGKSTYSKKLRTKENAVLLSVDEIMLTVFGQNAGENHNEYVGKIKKYFLKKIPDFVDIGISVILDWGFWTRQERDFTREFCEIRDIDCELHYIDINDELWKQRINNRNNMVSVGKSDDYFVDSGLLEKFISIFEVPDKDEIDMLVNI